MLKTLFDEFSRSLSALEKEKNDRLWRKAAEEVLVQYLTTIHNMHTDHRGPFFPEPTHSKCMHPSCSGARSGIERIQRAFATAEAGNV